MQDLKLTPVSHIVLGLLSWAGRATPYDLKAMAGGLSDLWSVQHAQLYAEPARLAAAGYLHEEREESGRRRKTYSLTERGSAALAGWLEAPSETFTELRDPGLLKLYFGADPFPLAAGQADLHRQKLEEYEQLAAQDTGDGPRGPWLALEAGIAHEREWVRFWDQVARGRGGG